MKRSIRNILLRHELRLLLRNADMWVRCGTFYAVSAGAVWVGIDRHRSDLVAALIIGLMILAVIGLPMSLAADSFITEKERRTMEALLLVPTTARDLTRIKSTFILAVAMLGVVMALLTGVLLVTMAGAKADLTWILNRATVTTAFVVCPPTGAGVAAIGTLISARSRSAPAAKATVALLGMAMFLPTTGMVYLVSTTTAAIATAFSLIWWTIAMTIGFTTCTAASPQTMIRTRGR